MSPILSRSWVVGWAALMGAAAPALGQTRAVRFEETWRRGSADSVPLFRPVSILVDREHAVWVADAGESRIARWRGDGVGVSPVGRPGRGPGEFQVPSLLMVLGDDTIGVWDRPLERLTLYDLSAARLGELRWGLSPALHGFVRGATRTTGGRWLVWTVNYPNVAPRPVEDSSFVWRVDPTGTVQEHVLAMAGPQSIIERDAHTATRLDAPFQRAPVVLFLPLGEFLVGNSGSEDFSVFDADGHELRRFRVDLPALSVTDNERAAFRDSVRRGLERSLSRGGLSNDDAAVFRTRFRRIVESLQFPETHQRYLSAMIDDAGALWLLLPARSGARDREWRRIRVADGTLVEQVLFHAGGPILSAAARSDVFYTIELGADDAPQVAKYARAR